MSSESNRTAPRMRLPVGVGLLAALLVTSPLLAAPPTDRIVVVEAGTVITATGEEYSPGMVVIEDGEITLVGQNLEVPSSARRIRARGETVMPGLVVPDSALGVSFTLRQGNFAGVSVLDGMHADEFDGTPFLESGFTAVGFTPNGAGFAGSAAVIRPILVDGSFEVLREKAYLAVSLRRNGRDRGVIEQSFARARQEIAKEKKAREKWEKEQAEKKKKAEAEAKKEKSDDESGEGGKAAAGDEKGSGKEEAKDEVFVPPPIDPQLAPLVAILRGDDAALPLLFRIGDAGNLLHLAEVVAGEDALAAEMHRNVHFAPNSRAEQRPMVPLLGEQGATVITDAELQTLPYTMTRVNLPAELARAGANLILTPSGPSRGEYLRFRARVADLVRSGLPRDVAIRSMTVNPARFLGLDERIGSIEKGRSADLIFLDGDPFDAATRVTRTMIAGEWVWEGDAP